MIILLFDIETTNNIFRVSIFNYFYIIKMNRILIYEYPKYTKYTNEILIVDRYRNYRIRYK